MQKMDGEIAAILNEEGLRTAHGPPFSGGMIHVLRKKWRIPTVKINSTGANPRRWPDGSYSVQGAAEILGIIPAALFDDWFDPGAPGEGDDAVGKFCEFVSGVMTCP